MADEPDDIEVEDEAGEQPEVAERAKDISRRAGVKKQLLELFDEVEKGFSDQSSRADEIADYWDIFNCKLNGHQFYSGNSQIFVPIVANAVNARKTRFVNQMFPTNGRNVEVISQDGELPYAEMSLLEHYIDRAKLRTEVMPALMKNGDCEGQYSICINWEKRKRFVTWKTWEAPPMEDGSVNPAAGEIETIKHEELEDQFPTVEVIADADLLVLPSTAASIPEAIATGGSVTVIRRWTKAKIRAMVREGVIREDTAESLIGQMTEESSKPGTQNKVHLEAAGIKREGGLAFLLVYQTWSILKVKGARRLCECFYGGEDNVLGARRNPLWSDKVPVISVPVEKVAGSFKGVSKIKPVADIQYFANDAVNEAADSAAYALLPIVMTDPTKNPRIGSMVLSLAAVWETSPQDTQFAQFPQLWQHGFEMVAAAKAEVAQALSVSPAALTGGGASKKSKPSQAEVAQEQQVDILTTADAVTVVEQGILSPMLEMFVEMDHQYRDTELQVKSFGRMGMEAKMQSVPPVQFDTRYQYRWFGVEQARAAQQIQQQIAMTNVLRGIPPEQMGGYRLNLAPLAVQLSENAFGPRLAPLILESPEAQMPVPVEQENSLLLNGFEVPTHPQDDDEQHIKAHAMVLQDAEGKSAPNAKKTQKHIWDHMQQLAKKQQAGAQQPQGEPGIPGGEMGGQPQPGVAGTPRIGAQPAQATGSQGPPGMIHHDQLHDPAVMPR